MSVVIGLDLGHEALRVAALVDGAPELVTALPAMVAWADDHVRVGAAARERPADERVDRLPAWLERTADEDDEGRGAPGPLTSRWPVASGLPHAPAEAVSWLVRAAVVAVEDRYGPVLGATFAVAPSLGAVGRRALRDAAAIAGLPASRQLAAPSCAVLAAAGAADGPWLVCDAGAGALSISVVERVAGALHGLAHVRDPELGGQRLDEVIADQLEVEGLSIDPDDDGWPGLCALARALKQGAPVDELVAAGARLGGRVGLPTAAELDDWLDARLRRVDELCQRALAASGLIAVDLVDVLAVGAGAPLAVLGRRLQHALGRPPRLPADPAAVVALGAATAARMFLAEPAALFLDPLGSPLALAVDRAREPLLASGTIAPALARQIVTTDRADQDVVEIELWEEGPRTRPCARYAIAGLPAAPAGEVVATCEVVVDADLVPSLAARELVSALPLAVVTVEEAAIAPAELAAARARVAAWRPDPP